MIALTFASEYLRIAEERKDFSRAKRIGLSEQHVTRMYL